MTACVGSRFSEESLTQRSTKPRRITTRNELGSKYACIHEVQSFFFFEDQADEFWVEFF